MSAEAQVTPGLGPHSQARSFFEVDEEFKGPPDIITPLLNAYEEAARYASLMARFALKVPSDREKAIWAEASASTLECILYRYAVKYPGDGLDDLRPWKMERG